MLQIFTKLADWPTSLIGLNTQTQIGQAIHFFIEDILKIFFLLILMVYLASWIRMEISAEQIKNWLQGKSRFVGYFLAAILGSITPFCSCSSIPLFIGFLTSGIPLGVAMAFLITSPLINEIAIVLFGESLGWPFTIYYISIGLSLGIIGGFLIDILASKNWVEDYIWQIKVKNTELSSKQNALTLKDKHNYAWEETKNIILLVWKFIFIGVALGAFIHGYIPKEWFLKYAGINNPFAVTVATFIGIPLYSNITGIIPIAKVLINKGLPIGTTLALILSTVAISLPEILILRKVLKPKALIFLIVFLFFAINFIGYIFNYLFPKGI